MELNEYDPHNRNRRDNLRSIRTSLPQRIQRPRHQYTRRFTVAGDYKLHYFMDMTKECRVCHNSKNINDFYRDKTKRDGYQNSCKKCDNERTAKYHQAHPEKPNEVKLAYIAKFPNRQKARTLVSQAIKKGLLVRKKCEICESDKSQAHHDDYTKPLDVRWLCSLHHIQWHQINIPTYE